MNNWKTELSCAYIAMMLISMSATVTAAPNPHRGRPAMRPGPVRADYERQQAQSSYARENLLGVVAPILERHGIAGDPRSFMSPKGGGQRSDSINHDLYGAVDLSFSRMNVDTAKANQIAAEINQALSGYGWAQVEEVGNFGHKFSGPDSPPYRQRDTSFARNNQGEFGPAKRKNRTDQDASASHIHLQMNRQLSKGEWQNLVALAAKEPLVEDDSGGGLVRREARNSAWSAKPNNSSGWKCNYSGTTHANPDECQDPHQGGVWVDNRGNDIPGSKTSGMPPLALPPAGQADGVGGNITGNSR